METAIDAIAVVALVLGLVLATIGLFGLLRLSEILHQLHAAGLVATPALLLVLLASIGTGRWEIITSAALMGLVLLVTSPLSNHAIAHAASEHPEETDEGG